MRQRWWDDDESVYVPIVSSKDPDATDADDDADDADASCLLAAYSLHAFLRLMWQRWAHAVGDAAANGVVWHLH